MGWMNSVPILHDDVTYILQPKIPHITIPYIDDTPVKGPKSEYRMIGRSYETIPDNPAIRHFVWEHFENLNRVVQRMKYCSRTFSGPKLFLCVPEIIVLGHHCNIEGCMADPMQIDAVSKWGPCWTLTEVKALLGTIGVCRIFIQNFTKRAAALINLTRKDVPFKFGPKHIAAQEDLKQALIHSPAIRAINYISNAPVILSVDTSHIAVGFFLSQCDTDNPRKRYYSHFGSITLNKRESRFSQAKLKLYRLYHALGALRFYLIGIQNLIIEVNARYIKGMLTNPDVAPSASINRWIVSILTFHFTLVHVAGTHHGPNGLSCRPLQDEDSVIDDEEDFGDWINQLHGFMHQINPISTPSFPSHTIPTFALSSDLSKGEDVSYDDVPHSENSKKDDTRLLHVQQWLEDMVRPSDLSDSEYATFMQYCTKFFLDSGRLW
jgi:hypothetical protein